MIVLALTCLTMCRSVYAAVDVTAFCSPAKDYTQEKDMYAAMIKDQLERKYNYKNIVVTVTPKTPVSIEDAGGETEDDLRYTEFDTKVMGNSASVRVSAKIFSQRCFMNLPLAIRIMGTNEKGVRFTTSTLANITITGLKVNRLDR